MHDLTRRLGAPLSAPWPLLAWSALLLAGAIQIGGPAWLRSGTSGLYPMLTADYAGATASVESSVKATSPPPSSGKGETSSPLFGMDTVPVTSGELSNKWRGVKTDIAHELEAVARCQASGSCPAPAQKLLELSAEGSGRSGRARVGLINRAVDLAIRPVSDESQWGVADRWSAPFETLQYSRGDCEDYAIVKYAALLKAGISADDLKIVILKQVLPDEFHAALAVRVDGQWLILDNRTLTLVRDADIMRAIPAFILDQQGVRRVVGKSRTRRGEA